MGEGEGMTTSANCTFTVIIFSCLFVSVTDTKKTGCTFPSYVISVQSTSYRSNKVIKKYSNSR